MKFSQLAIAVAASLGSIALSHAAGLERSGQSVQPLFEEGTYIGLSYVYADPNIEGTDAANNKIEDMLDDYSMPSVAVKVSPTPNTAVALVYDTPFGVDTTYKSGSMFNNALGTTETHTKTKSLTALGGGKVTNNIWLYGGIEYQKVDGFVTAASPVGAAAATKGVLSSPSVGLTLEQYKGLSQVVASNTATATQTAQYNAITNNITQLARSPKLYSLQFENDDTFVPVVGLAFEKPEIALRAAVTYRGPARYNIAGLEDLTLAASSASNVKNFPGKTEFEFPQSVNFDFQTGLSKKHQLLGMVNARWMNWKSFEIAPPLAFAGSGEPLAEYSDDQYSVEVGLGKRFTPRFSAQISAGYDSGTGLPLTLLGPYNSTKNVGLGGKLKLTKQVSISAGGQYVWMEGGDVMSGNQTVAKVDDGNGYAVGGKLEFNF